jgi:hypothetical protein
MEPSPTLDSFRNLGITTEAAVAEIIDNSIQANAKNIKIKLFQSAPLGKKKPRINKIIFGDDGNGMNAETIGYAFTKSVMSTQDRHSNGRFGVGLTFSSIACCKFVELYSRVKNSDWYYCKLDLKSPIISEPIQKDPPDECLKLAGDHGTVVVWNDMDRTDAIFDNEKFIHGLGRTYRKFIGEMIIENGKIIKNKNIVKIFVEINEEKSHQIHSFDPLHVIPNKNRPSDEGAKLIDDFEIILEDPPSLFISDDSVKNGKIRIKFSLAPESWRNTRHSGLLLENKARCVDRDNEGVSILRAGRELAYNVPIKEIRTETIDRFWCCEIDFDTSLDAFFGVNALKNTVKIDKELTQMLGPTIEMMRNKIHEDLKKAFDRERKEKRKY